MGQILEWEHGKLTVVKKNHMDLGSFQHLGNFAANNGFHSELEISQQTYFSFFIHNKM